jgi:hypothetical protein
VSSAEDLAAINQVANLYGHLIDSQAFERMHEVYTEGATYHSPRAKSVGLPAIVEYLSTNPQPLTHNTTNVYVELSAEGTEARGVAKFLCVLRDGTVGAGDYEDHWVRTEAGWRLEHRRSTGRAP